MLDWSLPPLLLYVAFRRYLQAMNVVRPVTYTLIAANIVNAVVNWILIFGHLGAPALGVRGSAYATLSARVRDGGRPVRDHPAPRARARAAAAARPRSRSTCARAASVVLGLPAGGQMLLEVGVFASATALAGACRPAPLAAHQIAINLASLTFMIPFGLRLPRRCASARRSAARIRAARSCAGWTAIALGVGFMATAAPVFLTVPALLIRAFTDDADVIDIGVRLLFVAAVFQFFDGLQGVTTGALRGLGDTRTAMLWNLGGHWLVGLPLGYLLCFRWGYGVVGLWWGLSVGLMICGIGLVTVWWRKGKRRSRSAA